jgi:hypothetical protein
MPTLITAGDATTGLTQTAASDGALTIQTGPAGSKVNAIALSSAGGATFTQITGGALTLATSQATTSGTSIDFTGIPSWVKRITVMFNGVSTNGTSNLQIQLGTGATPTYTTSGYSGTCSQAGGNTIMSAAFVVNSNVQAAATYSGIITICLVSGNIYAESGTLNSSTAINGCFSGGSVSLAAALTAVRITTANGTDTFDAGSVNILYEG